ncbi:MAG: porin family protein [Bacteroidota bacterium]|nr:porin family protein [Bacteroidota bacterium]
MKKIISTLIVFLFFQFSVVHAQILIGLIFGDKLNSDKMEFGLNVSANMTTMSHIDSDKFNRGLAIGLYIDYKFADHFALATSLLFSSPKGVRNFGTEEYFQPLPDSNWNVSKSIRGLSYMDLPLVVQYRPIPQIGIGLGIQTSLLLKAEDSFSHSYDDWDIGSRIDITDNFNRLDFGLVASLNFHFSGNPGVQIRLNYSHGLVNVYNSSANRTAYNRTFQLGAMIPIKTGVKKKDKVE